MTQSSSVTSHLKAKSCASSIAKPLLASGPKGGLIQSFKAIVRNANLKLSASASLSQCILYIETVYLNHWSTFPLIPNIFYSSHHFIGNRIHETAHRAQSVELVATFVYKMSRFTFEMEQGKENACIPRHAFVLSR